MLPYQIYQALSDQRAHELMAEARRHDLIAEARRTPADLSEPSSRLKNATGRILALLRLRDGHARSAAAPATGAGPMGCVA